MIKIKDVNLINKLTECHDTYPNVIMIFTITYDLEDNVCIRLFPVPPADLNAIIAVATSTM